MRHVRRATADDAEVVAAIGAALFRQAYEGEISDEQIREYVANDFARARVRDDLNDPNIVTLLAVDDGEAIAFAQLRLNPAPVETSARAGIELWRFYVERAYHGTSVAQALMREALAAARGMGPTDIWLSVWERNPRAIRFYEKAGFRHVGFHDFRIGATIYRDALMSKSLGLARRE